MSRHSILKTVSVLGRSIFALGFVLCALQSCGSSSSGGDTALCNQVCNREYSCTEADGGPAPAAAMTQCMTICAAQKCSNEAALVSAANICLAKSSCADFIACSAGNQCETSTTTGSGGTGAATGGTNGGGAGTTGSTGSGGTTGTAASCADCDKAATCCAAIAAAAGSSSGSSCSGLSAATCNAAGTDQTTEVMACDSILSSGAQLNLAACK